MADSYDVVIVGGGFGGGAMATVLARAGKSVLVLEKSTVYRDLVRGEWIAPWGVVEANRTGLYDVLAAAGNRHHLTRHVEYGEGIDPAESEAAPLDMSTFLPGIPGPLCLGHPAACEALNASAVAAGATVLRGVEGAVVTPGAAPSVSYVHDGAAHTVTARIVLGADGRNSAVRGQLGIELQRDTTHHFFSGMLVENAHGWPEDLQTSGTEGDIQFLAFPQGGGRLRLYMSYGLDQKSRLSGEAGPQRFLDAFALKSVPYAAAITGATIAGPCNSIPNEDTWTVKPSVAGAVLIGDAAGYNDPIIGQGLSITLRDVRIVSELLLGAEDWSSLSFVPYAEERDERMRRLRFAASIDSMLHAEFGERASRRRAIVRERRAKDPTYLLCLAGVMIGPEMLPPAAYSDAVWAEVEALGA
ncbi:MAG: NAD(P)/FAD-dependent oxidoreductase [Dehalococcoidia bacterium]